MEKKKEGSVLTFVFIEGEPSAFMEVDSFIKFLRDRESLDPTDENTQVVCESIADFLQEQMKKFKTVNDMTSDVFNVPPKDKLN